MRRLDEQRQNLVDRLKDGLRSKYDPASRIHLMFSAFEHAVHTAPLNEKSEIGSLTLVNRALTELLGNPSREVAPADLATTFFDLIEAISDRDESDGDATFDLDEATTRWATIHARLEEEFNRPQGGFARLMYGETSQEARRMIQLAFNRERSLPKVLVAQSMVGREGLNLHNSCRFVVMLHPEWNPAVVEQQIGRVDRVGCRWAKLFEEVSEATEPKRLPRIEVRPVIFSGTYDEHNWSVLRSRWDNMRSQLHGVVIPYRAEELNDEEKRLVSELEEARPDFSPLRDPKANHPR